MTTELINALVAIFFMAWLSITDIREHRLPNKIILAWVSCRIPLLGLSVIAEQSWSVVYGSIIGAIIIGAIMLAIYILSKKSLGGGDVKLGFAIGFALTLESAVLAIILGFLFAACFAAFRFLLRRESRMDALPLGAFFFAGVVVTYMMKFLTYMPII
jgi:leader peptidase (prepilin peptidase)/N-methyltransferase